MSRGLKQLFIVLVYVIIISGLGFWHYNSKYGATCYDNKQNGSEEGVDCGTLACGVACASPVQAIQVQSVQLVRTPAGDHDLAVQVYNPNTEYGAVDATYELMVGGAISPHDFYMLPGQTKYLVLTSLDGITDGVMPTVTIKSVQWEKVSGDSSVQFTSSNERYAVVNGATTFEANVTNNSDFDFDSVEVDAVVTDSSGALLSTNMTNLQTVLSRTSRYVKLSWPFVLPSDARVYLDIGTNVFDNDNFIKRHGTQEKFQQNF